MSVLSQKVFGFRTTGSRAEAVRAGCGAPLRPPFWLLLVGIIVIGIGIGLFAASTTALLFSSSAAQAADADTVSKRRLAFNPTPSLNSVERAQRYSRRRALP